MPPRRAGKGIERPSTPEASSPNVADDTTTPKARRRLESTTPKAQTSRVQGSSRGPVNDSAPSVPLPPFSRYDSFCDAKIKLLQLLETQLPPPPLYGMDEQGFLSQTKSMSGTERSLEEESVLQQIVHAPNLLDNHVRLALSLLQTFEIDFSNPSEHDFAVAISPWHSVAGLTPVMFSEKDIEDWVYRIVLGPALLTVLMLRMKTIPRLHYGLSPASQLSVEDRGPYVSSARSVEGSIPDAVIVDAKKILKATVEVKCDEVLAADGFIFENILATHQDAHGAPRPGRAVKFNWPEKLPSKDSIDRADKQTRIICQIYTQLTQNECDLGLLTSYVLSVFYYKKDQTLYMSDKVMNTEQLLLHVIAWMAMALDLPGFERSKLVLPNPVDRRFWQKYNLEVIDAPGVVAQTLPAYEFSQAKLSRSQGERKGSRKSARIAQAHNR